MSPSDFSFEQRLYQLVFGFMALPAIAVAAKLSVPDLVAESPKTLDELARATKADPSSLRRLLQFLASVGIFAEDATGRYGETPLSELLRSDGSQSFRGIAMMLTSEFMWRPWVKLHESVLTGQSGFEQVHGASIFEYLSAHPEDAAIFNAAMTSISSLEVPQILAAYDFSQFQQVADLGGAHGALLHGILSAHPKLRGILADSPKVVAGAAALRSGSVASRCQVLEVDLLQTVPAGADCYLMKYIVHAFNDTDAVKILKNCRCVMMPSAKLLLIERVLKPSNQPDPGRFMDLQMLVAAPGGRERNEADYRELLREADLLLTRVVPTSGPLSIVECQPL